MPHDLDAATATGRSAFASKMTHMCIALLPDLPLAEMLCVVMDERAVATWRDERRAFGMTDTELELFAPSFEHPERAAARGV
jgi:hypothetical protein